MSASLSSARLVHWFMRCSMPGGRLAGAARQVQDTTSNPGRNSDSAGISGATALRLSEVTARGRT